MPAAGLGGPYFVVSVDGFKNFDAPSFNLFLHGRYPSLFAQEPGAVPIMLRIRQGASESSDWMAPFFFGIMPMVYTVGLVGYCPDTDRSRIDVSVLVSETEESSHSVEIVAERRVHGLLFAPFANAMHPASEGWYRPGGDFVSVEFDGLMSAVADATAKCLLEMPPDRRDALRANPVALQRFHRKFPWGFGVQGKGVADKLIHVYPPTAAPGRKPSVLGGTLDAATRRGEIRADLSGCEPVSAQRWVLDTAVPRLCRECLGRDVSLLSVAGETLGPDGIYRVSFLVVE